jgi:hypothetical protein
VNKDDLPYWMERDPSPFDTAENLERRLAAVQARPDYVLKEQDIKLLKGFIEMCKRYDGA